MEDNTHKQLNNLVYSCMDQKQRSSEQVVLEHSLGYIISGEVHFQTADGVAVLKENTIGMIRKNQLVKSVKVPPPGGVFKSLNIFITREFLQRYAAENRIAPVGKYTGEPMMELSPDPFLKGYFDSLIPYFDHGMAIPQTIADIKTKEAVELILRGRPKL